MTTADGRRRPRPLSWWDVALTEDGAVWLSGSDAIMRPDPTTTGG